MFLFGPDYLAQRREPLLWVVQDLIPVGGKSNLFGKPKAGKSFFALQMASAISSGQPHFLGFPIHKHGPVVYIQVDTAASIWFYRVKAQEALGFDFKNVAFADTETGIPFPLNILAAAKDLKEKLQEIKPVLVVWDTIRELHPGDENDSSVMQNVVAQLVHCSRGEGWAAANLIISHRKKQNPNYEDDIQNAARGSSYMAGAVDSIIQLHDANKKTREAKLEFLSRTHPLERRSLIVSEIASEIEEIENTIVFSLHEEEEKIMNTLQRIISENPGVSGREHARLLQTALNIETFDAAHGLYKRRMKAFKGRLKKRGGS